MNNVGLCFKIFVNELTSKERITIIEQFLSSLKPFLGSMNIVGVIDNTIDPKISHIIDQYKDIKFLVLNNNYGISIATNIGIEYLINHNCEYIFCSDDDIVIKNLNVFNEYIKAIHSTNIQHLGYFPSNIYKSRRVFQENQLDRIHGYSGCFYVVTKQCIQKYGYLPVLNAKYGHEHVFFTKIITRYQYDIPNSDKLLELNINSTLYSSNNKHQINTDTKYKLDKPKQKDFWISQIHNFTEYN